MVGPFVPQNRDVVIRQDTPDGKRVFILHTAPGADQFILHTRDAAAAQAVGFATGHRVRVWLRESDHRFTLVENFRVASF